MISTQEGHSHSICIECMINGEKWATNVSSIQPWQLKPVIRLMLDGIINSVNEYYGKIVVTSIGNATELS